MGHGLSMTRGVAAQEPEERGLLRTVRANVKFYFFKHRAELKTERDADWWRERRAERAAARARVEEEAAALRDECKPRTTDMLSFAKEAGDQAFLHAEELVQDGKWKVTHELTSASHQLLVAVLSPLVTQH